jgi:hypothetical protein
MVLAITLTLVWLVTACFYFLVQKLTIVQNIIIYILLTIATRNVITILSLELNLIELPKDSLQFGVLLLIRELIIPFLVLIFINISVMNKSWVIRGSFFILIILCLTGLDVLSVHFQVQVYKNWNFLYAFLVNVGYLLIGLWLTSLVLFLQKLELKKDENL